MTNLTRIVSAHATAPMVKLARCVLPLVLLAMLAGCDHRVASLKNIDVCALLREPAAALLQDTPVSEGESVPPSAGYCSFTAQAGPNKRGPVVVTVMTSASTEPDDVSRAARLLLAEMEQTYGSSGTGEFDKLAKLAVAFNGGSGTAQQILIGERGVVIEIGFGAGGFGPEPVAMFVNDVWKRVLASRPSKP